MTKLYYKQETVKRARIQRGGALAEVSVKEAPSEPDAFPLLLQRTQCPRCIGDAGQSVEERTFSYCRPAVICDYFDRVHAKELRDAKQITCNHPKCKDGAVELRDLNHFKNYIEAIHSVKLRA